MVQQPKKTKTGSEQDGGVESNHAKGGPEVSLRSAKEDIRFTAATIIILLHLGVRDQVGGLLIHVKLLRRDRPVSIAKRRATERRASTQNAIDDRQILIELTTIASLEAREDGESFLQVVEAF